MKFNPRHNPRHSSELNPEYNAEPNPEHNPKHSTNLNAQPNSGHDPNSDPDPEYTLKANTKQDFEPDPENPSYTLDPSPLSGIFPRPVVRFLQALYYLLSYAIGTFCVLYLVFYFAPQAIGLFRTVNQPSLQVANFDHSGTMQEVLDSIRQEDCEYFVAFDAEGRKIFECTSNDPLMVDLPATVQFSFTQLGGRTIAHNHPSEDCPFSAADIVLSSELDAQVSIVVSRNYTYTLTPPATGWPDASVIDAWFTEVKMLYADDEELWDIVPVYDSESQRYVTSFCTTDALMELYVQEFGGTYTKAPTSTIDPSISEILYP